MEYFKQFIVWIVLVSLALFFTACKAQSTPQAAIEAYLQALVAKDVTQAVNASCAEWEEQALAEGAAFEGVTVKLEGLACRVMDSEEKSSVYVACDGKFVYSYAGGEKMESDLTGRVFLAKKEGNQWRMCGYPLATNP